MPECVHLWTLVCMFIYLFMQDLHYLHLTGRWFTPAMEWFASLCEFAGSEDPSPCFHINKGPISLTHCPLVGQDFESTLAGNQNWTAEHELVILVPLASWYKSKPLPGMGCCRLWQNEIMCNFRNYVCHGLSTIRYMAYFKRFPVFRRHMQKLL